jgi:hypothetical protein
VRIGGFFIGIGPHIAIGAFPTERERERENKDEIHIWEFGIGVGTRVGAVSIVQPV